MTRIVTGYPPNYAEIKKRFNPPIGTVYAYGGVIYSPHSSKLPADLVAHEEVHFGQQAAAGGPDVWWRRYLDDPEFRLEQEVEAYRVQYATLEALPRKERRRRLADICKTLASGMYGSIVTKEQARRLVTACVAALAALALAAAATASTRGEATVAAWYLKGEGDAIGRSNDFTVRHLLCRRTPYMWVICNMRLNRPGAGNFCATAKFFVRGFEVDGVWPAPRLCHIKPGHRPERGPGA